MANITEQPIAGDQSPLVVTKTTTWLFNATIFCNNKARNKSVRFCIQQMLSISLNLAIFRDSSEQSDLGSMVQKWHYKPYWDIIEHLYIFMWPIFLVQTWLSLLHFLPIGVHLPNFMLRTLTIVNSFFFTSSWWCCSLSSEKYWDSHIFLIHCLRLRSLMICFSPICSFTLGNCFHRNN